MEGSRDVMMCMLGGSALNPRTYTVTTQHERFNTKQSYVRALCGQLQSDVEVLEGACVDDS